MWKMRDGKWGEVGSHFFWFLAPKTEYIYQVAHMNFDVGKPNRSIDQELARQNEQVEKQREKMTEFWRLEQFGIIFKPFNQPPRNQTLKVEF